MIGLCLKCRSELAGKRQGAKFCGTSCRVAYNQQLKRNGTIRNEVENKDEIHLAERLTAGVKIVNLYMRFVNVGVSRMTLENAKCSVLEWAKSLETDSILKKITEAQKEKKAEY